MADETKTATTGFKLPDPAELGRSMADIAERAQRIVERFPEAPGGRRTHRADPLNIGSAFLEMTARLMADPARLCRRSWLLAGLHDAVAEHRAAHAGQRDPSR